MEILSIEDKASLEQAQRDSIELKKEITKAKQAGIDVAQIEKELSESMTQITAIQRVYFPTTTKRR